MSPWLKATVVVILMCVSLLDISKIDKPRRAMTRNEVIALVAINATLASYVVFAL